MIFVSARTGEACTMSDPAAIRQVPNAGENLIVRSLDDAIGVARRTAPNRGDGWGIWSAGTGDWLLTEAFVMDDDALQLMPTAGDAPAGFDGRCAKYGHSWVAGMAYVHADDLAAVVAGGRRVECDRCERVATREDAAL